MTALTRLARLARLTLLASLTLAAACGAPTSSTSSTSGTSGTAGASTTPDKPGKLVVSETVLEILDPITFEGEAELPASSRKTLDALAATLNGNPDIKLLEVGAFVTEGDEAGRQALADRRARVLVDYLIGKQVEPARLVPAGYTQRPGSSSEQAHFLVLRRGSDG